MRKSTIRFIGYCVTIIYTIYMFTAGAMPSQTEVDANKKEEERLQMVEEKNTKRREKIKYKLKLVSVTDANGVEIPEYKSDNIADYENVLNGNYEPIVLDFHLIVKTSDKASNQELIEDFNPKSIYVNFSQYTLDDWRDVLSFDKNTGDIKIRYTFSSTGNSRSIEKEYFYVESSDSESRVERSVPYTQIGRDDTPSGLVSFTDIAQYIDAKE